MEQSPRLSLSYVAPSQAQKHVTVNETFRRLDALVQAVVRSRTTTAEPASPAEGDAYIIPASATGATWSAYDQGDLAAFQDSAWAQIPPFEGLRVWVADTDEFMIHDGAAWTELAGGGGSAETAAKFGINMTADTTNKLAVKSDAILFNHDDVTPGSGDAQVKINKAAAGDTGTLLFQTGASGRAEFGLAGDDDYHVKVSANGSSWINAILVDKDTGHQSLLHVNAPNAPLDIRAGAVIAVTVNGRSIANGAVHVETTSGRSGFLLNNSNNYVPAGSSDNSIFQFHYPFDTGGDNTYKVFRIARGATLSDVFWVNLGGGAVFGSPTGGDKGAGAVNAQAVYDDNTLLSCYVFDQALDGVIDEGKWDARVPDRRKPDRFATTKDPETGEETYEKVADGEVVATRTHEPMRKFAARIGTVHDPLTLDGYAKHWKEKRHLAAMPNEASFDPVNGQLTTGEWIQRLVETVEIQAVLIEDLNSRVKNLTPPGQQ